MSERLTDPLSDLALMSSAIEYADASIRAAGKRLRARLVEIDSLRSALSEVTRERDIARAYICQQDHPQPCNRAANHTLTTEEEE